MATLAWPSVLVPSSEDWDFNAGASRASPQSLTGVDQAIVGPSGRVTASLVVPCNTRARVMAMRALLAGLDGRANTVIVGPCEAGRRPADPRSYRLSSAAAINATTLAVQKLTGGVIEVGQVLGLGGNRLHIITRINSVNGSINNVTVRPWLRAAYALNAPVEFGTPLCEMRLATDDPASLSLSLSRQGVVTLDLVEAPPA